MNAICVITARGGSKRIPRKNIREFCGKPIIAYSIAAALNSELFDEVMVSTDDDEIAVLARSFGARTPFMRSAQTSDDFSGTNDVLREVLAGYAVRGYQFDKICCLYPTAPFVESKDLIDAMHLMEEFNAGLVMPVVPYSYPPQRAYRITKEGVLDRINHAYDNARSQDLETVYHDAGQFYLMKTDRLELGEKAGPTVPLIRDPLHVQDIDNESDWVIAEMKYEALAKN